jgi:hypothetical protein
MKIRILDDDKLYTLRDVFNAAKPMLWMLLALCWMAFMEGVLDS